MKLIEFSTKKSKAELYNSNIIYYKVVFYMSHLKLSQAFFSRIEDFFLSLPRSIWSQNFSLPFKNSNASWASQATSSTNEGLRCPPPTPPSAGHERSAPIHPRRRLNNSEVLQVPRPRMCGMPNSVAPVYAFSPCCQPADRQLLSTPPWKNSRYHTPLQAAWSRAGSPT